MARLGDVLEIYIGKIAEPWPGKAPSAIGRSPVGRTLAVDPLGFPEDEHADPEAHGGPDKALHAYPSEHHAFWRSELDAADPEAAARFAPGAVGENLSTRGVTEADFCIGDALRVGSALLQVSLGRQPCWKLDAHTGVSDMAYRFRNTGRTGWYFRVLEAGEIGPGDAITLEERRHPEWSLARVIAARFDPRLDAQTAAALGALPELGEAWAQGFREKGKG